MNKTIKKIIKGIMIFQFLVTTIFAGGLLENGRWNPVNREKLEKEYPTVKLIKEFL